MLASRGTSRNVIHDTTTTYRRSDISNVLQGPEGSAEVSTAKLGLQCGDLVTLSFCVFAPVPVILVALFLVKKGLSYALRYSSSRWKSIFDEEKNAITLLATQLFHSLNKKLRLSWGWKLNKSSITVLDTFPEARSRLTKLHYCKARVWGCLGTAKW